MGIRDILNPGFGMEKPDPQHLSGFVDNDNGIPPPQTTELPDYFVS